MSCQTIDYMKVLTTIACNLSIFLFWLFFHLCRPVASKHDDFSNFKSATAQQFDDSTTDRTEHKYLNLFKTNSDAWTHSMQNAHPPIHLKPRTAAINKPIFMKSFLIYFYQLKFV